MPRAFVSHSERSLLPARSDSESVPLVELENENDRAASPVVLIGCSEGGVRD
jgi:hypothetical protein